MARILSKHKGLLPVSALKGYLAALLLFAAALGGCTADRTEPGPGKERQVAFDITVPGMKSPSARALDPAKEQEVAEIDVVIFRNSDNTLLEYHRVAVADIAPTAGGYKFKVSDVDNDTDITAAVIANASFEVSQALTAVAAGGSYAGASKAGFLEALEIANSASWNTSASAYWKIPMYGEARVTGSIYSGTLPEVDLTRMLAKVDVMNYVAPGDIPFPGKFKLTAVHVVNYNTRGRIAPAWNPSTGALLPGAATDPNLPADPGISTWADGNELTYTTSGGTVHIQDEIYLFEATAQSTASDGLRLVLEGDYTSADETAHYYYPVDFTSPAGNYIPVLRNNRYLFAITEAAGRGYDRLGEAVAARGVISNLRTTLLSVDESGIRSIVWDGQYFLGLATQTVTLGAAAGSTASVKCVTNYADGWEIDRSKGANDGIVYIGTGGWLKAAPAIPGDPRSDIGLEALYFNAGATRTAILYLRAGRLSHTLVVKQE